MFELQLITISCNGNISHFYLQFIQYLDFISINNMFSIVLIINNTPGLNRVIKYLLPPPALLLWATFAPHPWDPLLPPPASAPSSQGLLSSTPEHPHSYPHHHAPTGHVQRKINIIR